MLLGEQIISEDVCPNDLVEGREGCPHSDRVQEVISLLENNI